MGTSNEKDTYSVGAASRLTGLSPDVLRAWERRYGVVQPIRTPGGTRRYRPADLERLSLVKAAVDAGHRIGEVARLDAAELERRVEPLPGSDRAPIDDVLAALERLDASRAENMITSQLAVLGPTRFAQDFALPMVHAIGEAWSEQRLCIAAEHLGSALLRSLLGSALRPTIALRDAPVVVFATPTSERHELGLLIAALTSLGAGASPLYLGADLPASEMSRAVETAGAAALALSIVNLEPDRASELVVEIRRQLPESVELWLGGGVSAGLVLPDGVHRIDSLPALEQRVGLLRVRRSVR